MNAPDSVLDAGKRLSITIPQIDGGNTEISELPFNIFKTWRVKTHHHIVKRHFISARCDGGSASLDAGVIVHFTDQTTNTASYSEPCNAG